MIKTLKQKGILYLEPRNEGSPQLILLEPFLTEMGAIYQGAAIRLRSGGKSATMINFDERFHSMDFMVKNFNDTQKMEDWIRIEYLPNIVDKKEFE